MSTKVLLPAAGYGTRVKAKSASGKELLIDPVTNKPLIDWATRKAWNADMECLVISRSDKTDLNEYIGTGCYHAKLLTLEPEKLNEWPDTILAAKDEWADLNIMVLPDTRFFSPEVVLRQMEQSLMMLEASFAVFTVEDSEQSKFAMFDGKHIAEKPTEAVPGALAIGLIAFRKEVGEQLFTALSNKNNWHELKCWTGISVNLPWFKDITRGGSIESY